MKQIRFNRNLILMAVVTTMGMLLFSQSSFAQQSDTDKKDQNKAARLNKEAQQALRKNNFAGAEADYRKAIALDPKNQTAKYNLGNAYYKNNKNDEAMLRYKQAVKDAASKEEKHKALHNLGNTFTNNKMYKEAVEAYKDALRNNPKDEETRYNLALAKEMLDKNPPPPEDQNQDDQNHDQNQNQDQNQDRNEDKNNSDADQDKNEDKDDKGDEKDNKDKEQGEDEKDKGSPDDQEGDQEQPQEPQRAPGQLSPQQVQSLLDAMNNEEKRVQDKINAEKQRGVKVKSDKNW